MTEQLALPGLPDPVHYETLFLDPADIIIDELDGVSLSDAEERAQLDQAAVSRKQLGESITDLGMTDIPIVRRVEHADQSVGYHVVIGRQRVRYTQKAGWDALEVRCILGAQPGDLYILLDLNSNHNRRTPWLQTLRRFHDLLTLHGYTRDQVVARAVKTCGMSKQTANGYMRILELPQVLLDQVWAGKLTRSLAEKIASRDNTAARDDLMEAVEAGTELTPDLVRSVFAVAVAPDLSQIVAATPQRLPTDPVSVAAPSLASPLAERVRSLIAETPTDARLATARRYLQMALAEVTRYEEVPV